MAEFWDRYWFFCLVMAVAVAMTISTWALANHLEIVSRSLGLFRSGPFFLTLGHQVVYRLTVQDQQGLEKTCWVRLGGFFSGLFSDRIEVRWEPRH